MLFKNKRGFSEDGFEMIVYAIVFIFFAAILVFTIYFIFGQIKTPINDALSNAVPVGETSFNVTSFSEQTTGGLGVYNTIFPFLLIGIMIVVGISLFYVRTNPGFFFISIIIFGIVILLSGIMSNVYQQFSTNENFGTTSTTFNLVEFILRYYPILTLVIIAIGIIFMYAKPGSSGSGGL